MTLRHCTRTLWGLLAPLIVATCHAVPAYAATPTLDGHNSAHFSTASSGSVSLTTTSTNDIILACIGDQSNGAGVKPVTSVTDAAGLSPWAKIAAISQTDSDSECWWAKSTGTLSADSITFHLSGAIDDASMIVWGVNGAFSLTTPFDANVSLPATLSANGPGYLISNLSTNSAHDFAVLFAGGGANVTYNASFGCGIQDTLIDADRNTGGTGFSSAGAAYKGTTSTQSNVQFGISDVGLVSCTGNYQGTYMIAFAVAGDTSVALGAAGGLLIRGNGY